MPRFNVIVEASNTPKKSRKVMIQVNSRNTRAWTIQSYMKLAYLLAENLQLADCWVDPIVSAMKFVKGTNGSIKRQWNRVYGANVPYVYNGWSFHTETDENLEGIEILIGDYIRRVWSENNIPHNYWTS